MINHIVHVRDIPLYSKSETIKKFFAKFGDYQIFNDNELRLWISKGGKKLARHQCQQQGFQNNQAVTVKSSFLEVFKRISLNDPETCMSKIINRV